MRIYTKTGDKGESSLFDGDRVKKYNLRLKAYGELDHLNVILGKAKVLTKNNELKALFESLQADVLILSAFLATKDENNLPERVKSFNFEEKIEEFEKLIDEITESLPELHEFILPGGTVLSVALHEVRVICRKAERYVVELFHSEDTEIKVVKYLNRLSDLMFSLARQFETE